jgi:tRNA(adenine34) deaminase
MDIALEAADHAAKLGNVPVGAVALHHGQVIAVAGNLRETLQDPTAHAEMLVLRQAAQTLGRWRLEDVTLVVTLEPCAMCCGAIAQARVGALVFGAYEPKTGGVSSTANMLNPEVTDITPNVKADRAQAQLKRFFERRRASTSS